MAENIPTDPEAISNRHIRTFTLCPLCMEELERQRRAVGVNGIGGVALVHCEHNGTAGAWDLIKLNLHVCPTRAYFERLCAEYARVVGRYQAQDAERSKQH